MEYKYKYYFKPRLSDFDFYSIAHHSKFFCWFEEARVALFDNFPKYCVTIMNTYEMPVTNLGCKYIKKVNTMDELVISAKLKIDFDKPIVHFDYRLMDKNERILYAKAYTEHVFLDSEHTMILITPQEIKDFISEIVNTSF